MANIKITDLTAYTDAASTDVLPIVDVGADVTKKIAIGDVVKAVPLGTAALPGLAFDGDPNSGVYSPGADQVAISTNGTGRLFIDSSGRLGLGTSSPGYTLDISGTIRSTGIARLGTGQTTTLAYIGDPDTVGNKYISIGRASALTDVVNIQGVDAGVGAANIALQASGGNVGIGTQSPSNALEIDNSDPTIRLTETGGGYAILSGNTGNVYIAADAGNTVGSSNIQFAVDGTERARITADGRLGLGTSSPGSLLYTSGARDYTGSTPNTSSYDVNFQSGTASVGIGQSNGIPTIQGYGSGTAYNLALCPNAGKVGIGTTSPTTTLDVNFSHSNTSVSSPANAALRLQNLDATGDNYFTALAFTTSTTSVGTDSMIASFSESAGNSALAFFTDKTNVLTEKVRIDSSGRLGLGTSNPQNLLHLRQSSGDAVLRLQSDGNNGSKSGIRFQNSLDNNNHGGGIYCIRNGGTDHDLLFQTYGSGAGNTRMVIKSNGNVGIGTTSPDEKLDIEGTGDIKAIIQTTSTGATANAALRLKTGDYNWLLQTGDIVNGGIRFYSSTSGSERARIDSSGRLLVGTSSSATGTESQYAKLVVAGNTNNSTAAGILNIRKGSGAGATDYLGRVVYSDNDHDFAYIDSIADGSTTAGRLVFSTTADGASSPTERMRIRESGEIWFNTTTGTIGTSNHGVRLQNNGVIRLSGNVSSLQVALQVFGPTGEFKVLGDGDCENTNNSYSGISDIKLKENIVDASSQWDDLKALQVRNYNFKAETGFNTHTQIGLIAQEVELVSPGLVGESIDDETGESTKSVNYSVLYMKAVKALQEAMERIETLEQRLTDAGIA